MACEEPSAWEGFLRSHLERFIDLVSMKIWFATEFEDALCVEVDSSDAVWILSLVTRDQQLVEGRLLRRPKPQTPSPSFLLQGTGEQRQDVERLYADFRHWLGPGFSMRGAVSGTQKSLAIRVPHQALWFLRFPISLFCHWGYDEFSRYKGVEWIVSGKSFLQNASEHEIVRKELLDVIALIEHSVIVINTYQKHDSIPWRTGTDLLLEILSCFNKIEFQGRIISLKWYCNPTAQQVKELLLDPDTVYFFADFEASGGSWVVGDGGYSSWESDPSSASVAQVHSIQNSACVFWAGCQGRLRHIRLMRVFHCNSIFNAFKAASNEQEPADKDSIAGTLLNLGAQRVEGGMNEESYYDYLCALLYLLCEAEHLRFILKVKCMERGIDFNGLWGRANDFLAFCGHDPISI